MSVIDYILDGLEAELELERELGVRTIEIDRSLLAVAQPPAAPAPVAKPAPTPPAAAPAARPEVPRVAAPPVPARTPAPVVERSSDPTVHPVVFLHDRALTPQGIEMMAKIIGAMHRTAENTPIVVAPPLPRAKIYVVLGGLAMKKYFPDLKGEPGQWLKSSDGRDVLITYSPAYILRFAAVTPAVQKMKQDMWRSLKAVIQRLG